jgi:Flp pilus assembly protein TadG
MRMVGRMLSRFRRTCASLQSRRSRGQVAIYMALILTTLMGMVGAGVDYGMIVLEGAQMQNAADAAALAGARALIASTANLEADGIAGARPYHEQNGYTHNVNGTTVTYASSSSISGGTRDTMQVTITKDLPTRFWRVIGINNSVLVRSATAAASGGMVDVYVSLDLSLSMQIASGGYDVNSSDITQLRNAIGQFITDMQVTTGLDRGTKMGIARWAGVRCSWYRSWATNMSDSYADGDTSIDLERGPNASQTLMGEIVTPCFDDKDILTTLTNNKDTLTLIAQKKVGGVDSNAACPGDPNRLKSCPLTSYLVTPNQYPTAYGTPTTPSNTFQRTDKSNGACASNGWRENFSCDYNQSYGTTSFATGTKIPNAISVVFRTASNPEGAFYAWSTANGGRNNPATTEGYARKVLVIFTDGVNQKYGHIPSDYSDSITGASEASWDTAMVTMANQLRNGPDGVKNSPVAAPDDVEIYVVGFFCINQTESQNEWCASEAARHDIDPSAAVKRPCGTDTTYTLAQLRSNGWMSDTDEKLLSVSSSASGTCDHYFPIAKSDSLPTLFRVIAGSITRGKLQ